MWPSVCSLILGKSLDLYVTWIEWWPSPPTQLSQGKPHQSHHVVCPLPRQWMEPRERDAGRLWVDRGPLRMGHRNINTLQLLSRRRGCFQELLFWVAAHSLKSSPSSPIPIVFQLQPHYFTPMVPFLLKPRSPWWLPQLPVWCSCHSSFLLKQFSSPRSDHHPPANKQTNPPLVISFPYRSQFSSKVFSWILPKYRAILSNTAKDLPNLPAGLKMRIRYTGTRVSIFINLYAFKDCFLIDKRNKLVHEKMFHIANY